MSSLNNYRNIRQVIHPEIARLPAEHIEAVLESYNIEAESMEEWLGALAGIAKAVLPAVGQLFGGGTSGGSPGAGLGGSLGRVAGGILGGVGGGQRPSAPTPPTPTQVPPAPPSAVPLPGASSAAGHLLQTLLRPETLQALVSMLLGQIGRPSVSVGGTSVPVGAFSNLLGTLANEALSEHNAIDTASNESLPEYMRNYSGEALADVAVSQQRASVLFNRLHEAALEQERQAIESIERNGESGEYSDSDREAEAADSAYDAMDLADMNDRIMAGEL